jgi:hypothetical protein
VPRCYSDKFLSDLSQFDNEALGIRLARLCIKANLPGSYVAIALKVTKLTIYAWFRGKYIRPKRLPQIETFMQSIEADLASGVLPAKSIKDAKAYVIKAPIV